MKLLSAQSISVPQLVRLLGRCFSDYVVDLGFTEELLFGMIRECSVDLRSSVVAMSGDEPIAVALIGRRGLRARLASMAVVPESRRKGCGVKLVERCLAESRARGEVSLELEVIEANVAARELYERNGFTRIQQLSGFEGAGLNGVHSESLKTVDPAWIGRSILRAAEDLPWQVSGETILQLGHPYVGFEMNGACAVIDERDEAISLRSLFVPTDQRRQGRATSLMRSLFARYPKRAWRVPALAPESTRAFFLEGLGFEEMRLTQLHLIQATAN